MEGTLEALEWTKLSAFEDRKSVTWKAKVMPKEYGMPSYAGCPGQGMESGFSSRAMENGSKF